MSRLRRGMRMGKYRLERRIGEGASAEVWLGRDTVQGNRVALKIIPPQVVQTYGRAAIEHEARVAVRLDHPHILGVRNADWIGDSFILVSEPALRSLEGYVQPRRSPALALAIIRDVASALAYAHQQKVLHRDIKPGNILMFPGRVAKLGDFGTAKFATGATRYRTEAGTMGYMAPEQAYGRPRYASDVFSLGLTAYELLTGRLPSWPFEWPLEKHEVFEARVPEAVQGVLRKALAVDVGDRWQDGVAFHHALSAALEKKPAPARSRPKRRKRREATPFELEGRWFKRHHGRALGLAFTCHRCDGPIAEAMEVCPWCGTDRNSFDEITRYPLFCPGCLRGVRPEWTACPWCYPTRLTGNGRKAPPDPRAERRCTRKGCDGQLRPFMRYCPTCKTRVRRPWKVEGLAPCKKCRWPTSDRWRYCAWCARRQQQTIGG